MREHGTEGSSGQSLAESEPSAGSTREGSDVQPSRPPESDWILQLLIAMLNSDPGNSMGLTVTVGGSVVSGLAVHRGVWADAMRRLVSQSGDGTENSPVVEVFRALKGDAEPDADLTDMSDRTGFVHLTDATVDGIQMGYWRGRISRVDGWSLGVI